MTDEEKAFVARRTAAAYQAQLCPHCGQPMIAGVPAQDVPTKAPQAAQDAPEPSGWRDRPALL